ncbi:hypothetical protein X975_11615, partial [Stegodyphus mimosarum]
MGIPYQPEGCIQQVYILIHMCIHAHIMYIDTYISESGLDNRSVPLPVCAGSDEEGIQNSSASLSSSAVGTSVKFASFLV